MSSGDVNIRGEGDYEVKPCSAAAHLALPRGAATCEASQATSHTGWPKKLSHCQYSSINRSKNRQRGYTFFISFNVKWAKEYYNFVINILCVT